MHCSLKVALDCVGFTSRAPGADVCMIHEARALLGRLAMGQRLRV